MGQTFGFFHHGRDLMHSDQRNRADHRSTPPASTSAQADAQIAPPVIATPGPSGHLGAVSEQFGITVLATATARPLARTSLPIAIASVTEPPGEWMRIGSRRPPSLLMASAKAGAEPGSILPSTESHSAEWARTRGRRSPRERTASAARRAAGPAASDPRPRARPPPGRQDARGRMRERPARDGAFLRPGPLSPHRRDPPFANPGEFRTRLAATPNARVSARPAGAGIRTRRHLRRARAPGAGR